MHRHPEACGRALASTHWTEAWCEGVWQSVADSRFEGEVERKRENVTLIDQVGRARRATRGFFSFPRSFILVTPPFSLNDKDEDERHCRDQSLSDVRLPRCENTRR